MGVWFVAIPVDVSITFRSRGDQEPGNRRYKSDGSCQGEAVWGFAIHADMGKSTGSLWAPRTVLGNGMGGIC